MRIAPFLERRSRKDMQEYDTYPTNGKYQFHRIIFF